MKKPLWKPGENRVQNANITAFRKHLKVDDLYQWALEHPAAFWEQLWNFLDVRASKSHDAVLTGAETLREAQWFSGAKLNFAENLLREKSEREAIVFWSESGRRQALSYLELHEKVAKFAKYLRSQGVGIGDRVAGFLPNLPETIIAMLATSSIGAIWSSCSPDFGIDGVFDRFGQIEPKVLIAADGYFYKNKEIDSLARVAEIAERLPSLAQTVIVPYLGSKSERPKNSISIEEIFSHSEVPPLEFEQLPFDHPLYIMYSSGTTGVPKCIVHGAGGTLLQHLKELVLHTDLKPADRILYATTCGWMMWNWLVSSLAVGATVLLYDGFFFAREGNILFDLISQERARIFGTSAKFLALVEKMGLCPRESHDLSALDAILSTGSPLLPESFDYVYRDIKEDLCLSSISGGTDIVSCFALGDPTKPVYRGELQTRGLALQVDVFDEDGNSVIDRAGELVCTAPFPCMPIYFWNDPDGERYHNAYFDRFENVWTHGDWAELNDRGGMIIYGRSDATLNPGGVRIGTAEIYREVEKLSEILESIAVGQNWKDDVRVVLFVKLQEGSKLDEALKTKIKKSLQKNCSPRHVPAKIIAVKDIPRTISGKIVELAVRNVIHNRPISNRDALANPEALEEFTNLKELESD